MGCFFPRCWACLRPARLFLTAGAAPPFFLLWFAPGFWVSPSVGWRLPFSKGGARIPFVLSVGAVAYAFHERRRATHILSIEDRISKLREEMSSYLSALDRRAQLIDEVTLTRPATLPPPAALERLQVGTQNA